MPIRVNKLTINESHQQEKGCGCSCSHDYNEKKNPSVEKQTYRFMLEGLDCANCATKIERHLNTNLNYQDVTINFMNLTLSLNSNLSEKNLIKSLEADIAKIESGISVVKIKEESEKKDYAPHRILVALTFFVVGIILKEKVIGTTLFLVSYILVGYDVLWRSYKNIRKGKVFDENFLMSIATIGAIAIKDYPEATTVMLFYQVGEFFQRYAVRKSRRSISELMNIKPEFANVIKNGTIQKVNPSAVAVDDIIVIKPGERIPLDGIVIKGNSEIDNKALTGESMLVAVEPQTMVMNGAINITGLIEVRVSSVYAQSTVSKILDLVENASSKKAKSENFISNFSRYYTPIVVMLALVIAFIVPLFIAGRPFNEFFVRGLSFLVVSCPCALVISIPLSYFAGIGGLSRHGILVKGSNYIEVLSKVDTVIFDKTGTLTKGQFNVVDYSSQEVLTLAAIAESGSNHPIAKSVVRAYTDDLEQYDIHDVKEIIGKGIQVRCEGNLISVGNAALMREENISFDEVKSLYTVLYVAKNNIYQGYLVIADELKDDAKEGISLLKESKIKTTIMLSGDKKAVASEIGNQLGIGEVKAELLPHQKVEETQLIIQSNGKGKVAFVGDGINDAPALAMVDVGIAMGGLGSDAAIEAADIVLMNDKVSSIARAIAGSKKIQGIAVQNIVFAIVVKFAVLGLISFGLVDMWMAIFADVGVSLTAIINSLRGMRC